MKNKWRIFSVLATLACAALWVEGAQPFTTEWLPTEGRPGGFVSSDACKNCHKDEHSSWHRSYHRTMTQFATPQAVKADFNNVTLRFAGETFKLQKEDDRFWVEISDDNEPKKADEETLKLPIGMLTGFHHMQVFWMPAGAGNAQLGFPFTWLNDDKRWVPRETTFLRDPKLDPPKEIWNLTCIRCHSTAPQPRPDKEAEVFRTRVAELGIACEACHGPGEKHIEFQTKNKSEGVQTKGPDATIIHPKRLSHERSSLICAQCHSMRYFEDAGGWREHGFAFKPGEDLEEATPIMRPRKIEEQPWLKKIAEKNPNLLGDFFWSDGMIRVSGRDFNGLVESACYQKGKLSCLSCHSQHESDPNDQLAVEMETNKACFQCHDTFEKNLSAHTRHAANSSGSLCYNCHMPHTTYGLMKAIRSHEITRPTVAESVQTGRPNACNLCHLDKTLAWTADRLQEWYKTSSPELTEEQKKVPAGVLWALKGEAGVRALAAWHFGWKPAQESSRPDWMAPFLAPLLNDSYAAVRYIAGHSMNTLPGYADVRYDFIGDEYARVRAGKAVMSRWERSKAATPIDPNEIPRLLKAQDSKSMRLRE